MRQVLGTAAVALMLSGSAVLFAAPAFAGADEAQMDSFWSKQAAPVQGYAHGQYLKVDPRDTKVDPNASTGVDQADASNPYFNHAEGTMSGPDAVAQAPSASTSGQYVASYHQYMQVDPRDANAPAKADGDASQEMLYDHAMGTMSR